MSKHRRMFIVATTAKEAQAIAEDASLWRVHYVSARQAHKHLADGKAPPTDPYYANMYRVYTVKLPAGSTARSTG